MKLGMKIKRKKDGKFFRIQGFKGTMILLKPVGEGPAFLQGSNGVHRDYEQAEQ
jgi:hypothetical protein